MKTYVIGYPAIIERDKEDKSWLNVTFPNIIPGMTCGDSFDNAIFMAKDLLRLMIETEPERCFIPDGIEKIKHDNPGKEVMLIEIEVSEDVYKRYMSTKEYN